MVNQLALKTNDLGKSFGDVKAVEAFDITLNEGETLSLLGQSGCGKTTTSRCILRAIEPTTGEVNFLTADGQNVDVTQLGKEALRELRQDMQMIFQDPFSSLNPRMMLLDIVGEPLLVHGMKSRSDRADRVAELLRLVGLRPEYMRRFPHAFSGGERQRIGIARALYRNSEILVFDEPTSSLDSETESEIMETIYNLKGEKTIIIISHKVSILDQCDRIIKL